MRDKLKSHKTRRQKNKECLLAFMETYIPHDNKEEPQMEDLVTEKKADHTLEATSKQAENSKGSENTQLFLLDGFFYQIDNNKTQLVVSMKRRPYLLTLAYGSPWVSQFVQSKALLE